MECVAQYCDFSIDSRRSFTLTIAMWAWAPGEVESQGALGYRP